MPGARHPQKTLASFWMHRDIYTALGIVAKVRGVSMTRLILESLADRFEFTLDEVGNPVGLNLEKLAVEAFEKGKRSTGKRAPSGETANPLPPESAKDAAQNPGSRTGNV